MLVAFTGKEFEVAVTRLAKSHGATNNSFLARFQKGDVSKAEFNRVAVEFFHFSREWPAILATLLVNTPDEAEQEELTKILASELGDGNPKARHELLFRNFLRSIDMDPVAAMKSPMLPRTKDFIDGLKRLFSDPNHFVALGAEFGLEMMAIPMWDRLIPGLMKWREHFPDMQIAFFTFHRELEEGHEEAIGKALKMHLDNKAIQKSFRKGAEEVLNLLEAFWTGVSDGNRS